MGTLQFWIVTLLILLASSPKSKKNAIVVSAKPPKKVRWVTYKHKEAISGRKILCEQKHVAAKITFSFNIRFVYLDETWIYQNGSPIRRWVHKSD
jgi:hypothetical protein